MKNDGGKNPILEFELVVVCPTSQGGHIEHALEVAKNIPGANSRTVITRRGAIEYSEEMELHGVNIVEKIPSLSRSNNVFAATVSLAARLVVEMLQIWLQLQKIKTRGKLVVLIFEEARYPSFFFARFLNRQVKVGLFVHNITPHGGARIGVKGNLQNILEKMSRKSADALLCHGRNQADSLRDLGLRTATWLPLPGENTLKRYLDSAVTIPNVDALCLGEIRPNKGIEFAIAAIANLPGRRLTIAGSPVDPGYALDITKLAESHSNVDFLPQFLSDSTFETFLRSSEVVLLPYTTFDAQSGVLAKAMYLQKKIVCSEISALTEQAAGYPNIVFFLPGDSGGLATALNRVSAMEQRSMSPNAAWSSVGKQIFETLRSARGHATL